MQPLLLNPAEREDYKRKQQEWHDSHYKSYDPPLLRASQAELLYRTFELQVASGLLKDSGFNLESRQLRVLFSCVGCGEGLPYWLSQYPIREIVGVDLSVEGCRLARRVTTGKLDRNWFVQADAESLPFPDESFDLAIVHNGLHHLTDPAAGLRELWRIAKSGVVVIEPANSWLMPMFLKLGIARSREDSGNEVVRFRKEDYLFFLGNKPDLEIRYRRYFWYEHRWICDGLLPRMNHRAGRAITGFLLNVIDKLFFFLRTKSAAVVLKRPGSTAAISQAQIAPEPVLVPASSSDSAPSRFVTQVRQPESSRRES